MRKLAGHTWVTLRIAGMPGIGLGFFFCMVAFPVSAPVFGILFLSAARHPGSLQAWIDPGPQVLDWYWVFFGISLLGGLACMVCFVKALHADAKRKIPASFEMLAQREQALEERLRLMEALPGAVPVTPHARRRL